MPDTAIVIGAGGTIAAALIRHLLEHSELAVAAISRGAQPDSVPADPRLQWHVCDNREADITATVADLRDRLAGPVRLAVISNGILHGDELWPEKRLEDIQAASLQSVYQSNCIVPMLWVSRLLPILKGRTPCQLVAFSARVGSIGDNSFGGWYAYRGSKAALNMMMKSAAIEYRRRARNCKLVVFHPGTTDSPLSAPFQARVPEEKLFSAEFVAARLADVLAELPFDGELSFLAWDGQTIPW